MQGDGKRSEHCLTRTVDICELAELVKRVSLRRSDREQSSQHASAEHFRPNSSLHQHAVAGRLQTAPDAPRACTCRP